MRDDSHFWDPPASSDLVYRGTGLVVTRLAPTRQTILSGVEVRRKAELPLVSWPDPAPDGPYAIVLRRDRIIEIDGPARQDGWDETLSRAVNDVTDGYSVFQIDGTGALDLLKCGGFIDPDTPSGSVSRMLFGLPALLYRGAAPDSYRVHVARAYEEALRKIILSHLG